MQILSDRSLSLGRNKALLLTNTKKIKVKAPNITEDQMKHAHTKETRSAIKRQCTDRTQIKKGGMEKFP